MRTAPNVRHSKLLKNMCNEFDLCDPFRAKFNNNNNNNNNDNNNNLYFPFLTIQIGMSIAV